jgi:SAM-dependent methyltransferase
MTDDGKSIQTNRRRALMEWYEEAFGRMYPVLYEYRDVDEAMSVVEEFGDIFLDKAPILDLASGSGRYLEALLSKGFDAYGLDLSQYLLRRSVEEWGHTGRLVQADMRHLPFADGSVGAVWNMFTSFGYFSADTDNLLVFREVHRVLERGGLFLFDFINARKISVELLEESRRRSGDFDIVEKRRLESHGKYLVKHATVTNSRTKEKEHIEERLRLYTKDDLFIMFKSVGFVIEEVFGDYARNAFAEGVSERVIVVAMK